MTTLQKHLANLGRKGGRATAKNRTAEQRSEAARKAVEARWAKNQKRIDAALTETEANLNKLLQKMKKRKRRK